MATKTKATKGKPGAKAAPTPAELRDAIRAVLAPWFPHCKDASLLFAPGPGMPPLELWVMGDVMHATGLSDRFASEGGGGRWEPDGEGDES